MKVLGIVTARGGSKGIHRKNLADLNGKPLLAYTAKAALEAQTLDHVILSTDDEEIATVGTRYGLVAPFRRPEWLATDAASSIDVAIHAIEWVESNWDYEPDAIVILQPTSPLRTAKHIEECVALMSQRADADTVVSVVPVPHRFNPRSIMSLKGGQLFHFLADQGGAQGDRFRRQNLPPVYARNGPAVLLSRTSTVLGSRTFYGDVVLPYEMDELDSLDIDSSRDLILAEALLQYQQRENAS